MDNIKTGTGLSVEESIRMTKDRVNGKSTSMVWPTLGSRTAEEQEQANELAEKYVQRNERTVQLHKHSAKHFKE